MTTTEIIDQLQRATLDLVWVSESDYPFEVMSWPPGTEINPALFKDLPCENSAVETIALLDFFEPALMIEDWYKAEELAQVNRYTDLLHAIESNLEQVQVFRVGEVEVTIYIVGRTADGSVVGLKTQVIET
jgi:Nuclease A inhibitor-like protein